VLSDTDDHDGPHAETFTSAERAYIRSELDRYFTALPTVAEGLMPRTWRTGPRAGQSKLGPAAQSLLDRAFVSLDPHSRPPRLFFTETGLAALRAMMRDRGLAIPKSSRISGWNLGSTRRRRPKPPNRRRQMSPASRKRARGP
jgi:hypothetical protein